MLTSLIHALTRATMFLAVTALAGCAVFQNPISQTTAFEVINGYGLAQSVAVAYTKLPFCAAGTHASGTSYCKEQSIVRKLADADASANIARRALEAFVHNPANYPGLTYAGLLGAFQLAVTTFSKIEAQNGVH